MLLRRLEQPVKADQLPAILNGEAPSPPSRSTELDVRIESAIDLLTSARSRSRAAQLEAEGAALLHAGMKDLPTRLLLDPALWSWLAVEPFREFVIVRWFGGLVPALGSAVAAQDMIRWSLTGSLRGFANHSIARLFWSAEHLGSGDDYGLTRVALNREDLFKQVFERELCLHPPAARACVARYAEAKEAQWRWGLRGLNLVLSTTSVEYLTLDDLDELLDEIDSTYVARTS